MPLKLSLKPGEKVLIGSAVVANGPHKNELVILNRVPVLREKEIITPEEADTPAKKLYVTILNMYVNPDREREFHQVYFLLLNQLVHMSTDMRMIDLVLDVSKRIIAGDHYRALKLCRKLIDHESEVQENAQA
ncbi:flagellar biosynthesis repressor FlbT [Roseospirillum parvum]|uniref:Flagellar protein FlbT n=1 Tax=Roseospirillum parvum TaxID=83401 RepID=A0A1G8BQ70_9PROT|nr:flagellar biosynthesis repressor FlbT [Roseospirillum parvum]SDH35208.1 flagellar protein FlbT [Roseospirillum parvum]